MAPDDIVFGQVSQLLSPHFPSLEFFHSSKEIRIYTFHGRKLLPWRIEPRDSYTNSLPSKCRISEEIAKDS